MEEQNVPFVGSANSSCREWSAGAVGCDQCLSACGAVGYASTVAPCDPSISAGSSSLVRI
jgi:hypothetical protein